MPKAVHQTVADARLEPWPIAPEQVVAGQPAASGAQLHAGENDCETGIWECTPGTFDWHYEVHQSLCLTAGEAEIQTQGGERFTLRPGDAAFFEAGTKARWTVRKTVRKLYTLYR